MIAKPRWDTTGTIARTVSAAPDLKTQFTLALLFAIGVLLAGKLTAQTFRTLHSFTGVDGAGPAGVIVSGNTLYGMTESGGAYGNGSVYAVKTDGSAFTTLHSFSALTRVGLVQVNSDGCALGAVNQNGQQAPAPPQLGLVLSGNTLYGTTCTGGINGSGTVFKVNVDGTHFAVLHHFAGTNDGANPMAGLVLSSNTLYGTTMREAPFAAGEIFRVNTDGSGFAVVHKFHESYLGSTADDGAGPMAGLIISGTSLYGITLDSYVFKVNTDGSDFSVLHRANLSGTEGTQSCGSLFLGDNRLYGTASSGGVPPFTGTIFAVNTDGTDFQVLHEFNGANYDGASPEGGMILLDNKLYGTTVGGGGGWGCIYRINTDGTGYETLYNFSQDLPETLGGAAPSQTMALAGTTFFGTTLQGGTTGKGTVFSFSLPDTSLQSAYSVGSRSVILTWPTNNLRLESTTNLASPVWTSVPAGAAVINGRNTITNSVSSPQQFFRLRP